MAQVSEPVNVLLRKMLEEVFKLVNDKRRRTLTACVCLEMLCLVDAVWYVNDWVNSHVCLRLITEHPVPLYVCLFVCVHVCLSVVDAVRHARD